MTSDSAKAQSNGREAVADETVRLGRYRLGREIGRGFSSVVFEALDLQRQQTVAVKVLTFLQSLSPARREDLSERFAREARAISALSHPGIVSIYEVGHADDGREFIAMEFLPGESLRARLQRVGALPAEEAVTITLQVADALQFAHEHSIIHRDVKPDNIFVLPDGRVKLMDFGVAHVLSDEALTQTGTVVGSPAYMSPEQINGEHLDGRSDVFSLGVCLAEMVVGHKPFEAATIPAVMHRILTRPPQMEAVSPRALRKIIEKSLSKNRTTRYQSAASLADTLRRQVLPALPMWEPTSTTIMPAPTGLAAVGAVAAPRARRPRTVWWAAGAIGAGALALAFSAPSLTAGRVAPPPVSHRPVQLQAPSKAADIGSVRHIPAYWRRGSAAPAPPHPVAAAVAAIPHRVLRHEKPLIKIAEAQQPTVSGLPVTTPTIDPPVVTRPIVPAGPVAPVHPSSFAHTLSPRLAEAAARISPVTPHTPPLKTVVVKVGDFRQETPRPPKIAPLPRIIPSPASPMDRDVERLGQSSPSSPGVDTSGAPSPSPDAGFPDTPPMLVQQTRIFYPEAAWEAGLEGTTTLRVSVDNTGNVTAVTVLQSAGAAVLDDAAVQTARHWGYAPGFRNGAAVAGSLTVRIPFER